MLRLNQKGDTIVEVAIAMTILGIVLVAAYQLSNRAQRIGRDAKERMQAAQLQQRQAEALRGYRDDVGWGNFSGYFATRLNPNPGPNPCSSGNRFYMRVNPSTKKWEPVANNAYSPPTFGNLFSQCVIAQDGGANELLFHFYISWQASGSNIQNQSTMTTKLTDIFTVVEDVDDCTPEETPDECE